MSKAKVDSIRATAESFLRDIEMRHQQVFGAAFLLYIAIAYAEHINFSDGLAVQIENITDVLKLPLIVVFFGLVIVGNGSRKRLLVSTSLIVLGGITWVVGGSSQLFWAILILSAACRVSLRDVARLMLFAALISMCATLALWAIGYAGDAVEASSANRERLSLGFGHPNTLALMMFTICASLSMLRVNRPPTIETLVCVICALASYVVPNSRTFALALLMWPLLLWGLYLTRGRASARTCLISLLCIGVVFVIAGSFLSMVFFDPEIGFWEKLDSLLSGRLELQNHYFNLYPVSLFGHEYSEFGTMIISGKESTFVVDNAFCHIYLRFGLVGLSIVLLGFALLARKALREKYFGIAIVGLLFYALLGAVEGCFFLIAHNLFLFAFSTLLSEESLEELEGQSLKKDSRL